MASAAGRAAGSLPALSPEPSPPSSVRSAPAASAPSDLSAGCQIPSYPLAFAKSAIRPLFRRWILRSAGHPARSPVGRRGLPCPRYRRPRWTAARQFVGALPVVDQALGLGAVVAGELDDALDGAPRVPRVDRGLRRRCVIRRATALMLSGSRASAACRLQWAAYAGSLVGGRAHARAASDGCRPRGANVRGVPDRAQATGGNR